MRYGTLRLPAALVVTALVVSGCGGSDDDDDNGVVDPGPEPIPSTLTITGPARGIALMAIGETATITVFVQDQFGQEITNPDLTFISNNPSVVSVNSAGVVTAVGDGSTVVDVSIAGLFSSISATVTVSELPDNVVVGTFALDSADVRFFDFNVPAADAGETRALEVRTNASDGDADLLVRFGSDPTETDFDCASVTSTSVEFCIIPSPAAGTWRIALDAFKGFTGLVIRARLAASPELQDGEMITAASDGEFLPFEFVVPGSAGPSGEAAAVTALPSLEEMKTTAGEGLLASLETADRTPAAMSSGVALAPGDPALGASTFGGSGDVDLIGGSGGFLANSGPFECLSSTDGNLESCVTENPTPGRWQFALFPFAPFADVNFLVDFDENGNLGGAIPGTLTIQKVVQSSTGGAPDNPANPSLEGFVFEIRPAGSTTAVAQATTDSTGVAKVDLLAGSYDVVETLNQGLTDVTGSVTNVMVPGGGNVDVDWINRQAEPGAGGGSPPIAIINASPITVPAGDGNQTEVRLFGGNSSDPEGTSLTFAWSAPNGTFIGSTASAFARVTFPGGTAEVITLTVTDQQGNEGVAQVQIAGPGPLPAAGTYNIELVPIAPITDPDAQAAFDLAEATWEAIIRTELSNVNFSTQPVPPDTCVDGQPEINDTVDDLRIFIEFAPIDGPGGTLARAGPCFVRTPGTPTPIVGVMSFDSDDFGSASAQSLNRTILHEMAHVIGIGTIWDNMGLIENPSCPDTDNPPDGRGDCTESSPSPDTRYTGVAGSRAYRALSGPADANVPVENGEGTSAGPGTRDGHWREIVFGTELMTGFLSSNVTNPLSILTIESLRDIGYSFLDASQADNYSIPGPAPTAGVAESEYIDLKDDLWKGPLYLVTPDGTTTLIREGR
ncbi:MAG: leishmanolysin-related zinc metalloendopeptidase [Longimicrobiales bacterium]|nr:leishmanolysin-related zinc metalloendopeptidase [Longimicrobiales bacterium]